MTETSIPFEAHIMCRSGFTQTVAGSRFPGKAVLPNRSLHKVKVGPRSVLVLFEIHAKDFESPVVILAHGMGGCSESGYMRRIAAKLSNKGFGVVMMNHRGSGSGMGMSDILWNGGSSEDLERTVEYVVRLHPRRNILLVGFSLSGNILLKYLGEGRRVPSSVQGAFAVNPPIDLKVSSEVISRNSYGGVFNRYYLNLIQRQREALGECFPEAFNMGVEAKTIREFDEVYTAPAAGYKDADEYYRKSSSKQFFKSIQLPTRILFSRDDPFIPSEVFQNVSMNSYVDFQSIDRGGHMGYICKKPTPLGDRHWMDFSIVDWALSLCGASGMSF